MVLRNGTSPKCSPGTAARHHPHPLPASPRPSFSPAALQCVLPRAQQPPGLLLHLLCCCFPRPGPAAGISSLRAAARCCHTPPSPRLPAAPSRCQGCRRLLGCLLFPFLSFFHLPKQAATGSFKHSPADYSPLTHRQCWNSRRPIPASCAGFLLLAPLLDCKAQVWARRSLLKRCFRAFDSPLGRILEAVQMGGTARGHGAHCGTWAQEGRHTEGAAGPQIQPRVMVAVSRAAAGPQIQSCVVVAASRVAAGLQIHPRVWLQ